MKEIIVLHRYGARSHYQAVENRCEEEGIKFSHYRYPRLLKLFTVPFKFSKKKITEEYNTFFKVTSLFFKPKKKIIVGDNPYSYHILMIMLLGLKHSLFYHSSWPFWEGDRVPTKPVLFKGFRKKLWQRFLEKQCNGIFAVTNAVKKGLMKNYTISCPIEVVGHSHPFSEKQIEEIRANRKVNSPVKVLIVSRMIRSKGVYEAIECAKLQPEVLFTFVGSGKEEAQIKELCNKLPNARFIGFVDSKERLANLYKENDFVLIAAKRLPKKNWEELFGMVHIEALACGTIPIATNHIGPREIISHGENGFLLNENNLVEETNAIIKQENLDIKRMSEKAFLEGEKYTLKNVALKWENLFHD